jgi:hypothetical protein
MQVHFSKLLEVKRVARTGEKGKVRIDKIMSHNDTPQWVICEIKQGAVLVLDTYTYLKGIKRGKRWKRYQAFNKREARGGEPET